MPEVETPPTEGKPQSAFAAALEKAMQQTPAETSDQKPVSKEQTPPAPKEKEDKPPEKKGVPRDLFKKSDATKPAEATAPTEAKSALDDIAAPEFKDEKSKKGWEHLKSEAKSYEKKALDLEKQIAEWKANGRDPETLESKLADMERRIKESDELVTRARLEDHPKFRAEFIEGREKLVAKAKAIISEGGGDPKQIEAALNLKGAAHVEAMREVTKDMSQFETTRLVRVMEELHGLDERAQEKRDAAKKAYDELREQDKLKQAEASAAQQKNRGLKFDDTVRDLRGKLEVLQSAEGHPEWNARGERIVKEAREFVEKNPGADIEAEIYSRALPAYRDMFLEADGRVAELEKKLAEREEELKTIHGKSPRLVTSGSPSSGEKSRTPFSDALQKSVNGGE